MSPPVRKRGFLLSLAAEGMAPAVGGCAGALISGPVGGVAGVVVGQVVERAINFFGQQIVERWSDWMRGQNRQVQLAVLNDLANLPADQARREAEQAIAELAPNASTEDRAVAVEYLCAVPRAVQRSLVLDPATGGLTLPAGLPPDNTQGLLRLLPTDVPPYRPNSPLPGTPYRLGELLGSGGFGAVYRATAPAMQHLTFAVKFCLDPSTAQALQQEKENLEKLIEASQGQWTSRLVRLYGYDLEHPTPFLVYEYVPGGDLTNLLSNLRQQTGRNIAPDEVFALILQITEALAFAHERGLVHRDLKPANILVQGQDVKLADFGIGGAFASEARHSRVGTLPPSQLSCAEQVSLFRGAGTPLYMSPEQRRGDPPDPRQDLYSLGVLWYQLLVGDVARELHPGWARELTARHQVPATQIALIEQCVGWIEDRPRHAGELLERMRQPTKTASTPQHVASTALSPEEVRAKKLNQRRRLQELRALLTLVDDFHAQETRARTVTVGDVFLVGVLLALVSILFTGLLPAAPSWFFLFVLVAGAVLLGRFLRARRFQRTQLTRVLALQRVERLVAEFPDEIQAWGGKKALLNRDMLREVIQVVESETSS